MKPISRALPIIGLSMLLGSTVVVGTACSTVCEKPSSPATMAEGPRLIVKLKDPAADPSQAGLLSALSQAAGVELVYVRAMSGGAHVLQVRDAMGAATGQSLLRRLAAHEGVEYAEADRLMKPAR